MCGIIFVPNCSVLEKTALIEASEKLKPRGPDLSQNLFECNHFFGFHRLCINDLSVKGMQPFVNEKFIVLCNGEIYNHELLRSKLPRHEWLGTSDCEIIAPLIEKYGISIALKMMRGVFAFVIYDRRDDTFTVCRDAIGIKSLYIGQKFGQLAFASELKSLDSICDCIEMFPAGHVYHSRKGMRCWANLNYSNCPKFSNVDLCKPCNQRSNWNEDEIKVKIVNILTDCVNVRCENTDRPVGCFLSGGLDSSLVAALVAKYMNENGKNILRTFSVGMAGATDLIAARKVADYIGSEHHELIVTREEMIEAIPRVVKRIESYDITTVRASTGMVLLSDYIKENFDTTVIFSGEGADELSGSYKYFDNAPSPEDIQNESTRLVKDLQYFDVLRCDKSVSGSGLEARTPILDMKFVDFYMRIHPRFKRNNPIEKRLLRDAFRPYKLLPPEILDRKKEAFSDGVSDMKTPWFKIIQDHCESIIGSIPLSGTEQHNMPFSKESAWYRQIFDKCYPGRATTIPYFWLPKWTEEKDPSARLL